MVIRSLRTIIKNFLPLKRRIAVNAHCRAPLNAWMPRVVQHTGWLKALSAILRGSADAAGADMTNSVMDRVAFDKADLSDVKFHNAVITGATFIGTNLQGASFDEALIGGEDAKRLCVPISI